MGSCRGEWFWTDDEGGRGSSRPRSDISGDTHIGLVETKVGV